MLKDLVDDDNPFGVETELVHEPMCWKEHGLCAIKLLNEMYILLGMAKKTIDKDILIKIMEG